MAAVAEPGTGGTFLTEPSAAALVARSTMLERALTPIGAGGVVARGGRPCRLYPLGEAAVVAAVAELGTEGMFPTELHAATLVVRLSRNIGVLLARGRSESLQSGGGQLVFGSEPSLGNATGSTLWRPW